ncbi:M20 family metallopeptidase [Paenibacillus periandrae]|uniref:M20 family metallopeptidase n=1 Tax=Paenibacillus periandrae TaxID=1761741 RepID=UPI001F099CB4|nr:M20 family metallopeptidase [Paenibacillus periandrae]
MKQTHKKLTNAAQSIAEMIEKKRDLYIGVSDQIWEYAETRYEEHQSAELMAKVLEQEGFTVQRAAGGIATAVVGSYGQGKPVIAILGEFDALFGLSQKKGESLHAPVMIGGNGHGCGHNLLGSGMLAAAVAVKAYMEEHKLPGTIRYYGCPAEEGGGGKGFMARNGLFDDVDAAFTWHPESVNAITSKSCLATCQVYFKFKGRSAHAAVSPHLGRGALDAVELMNVGANYLREHLIPEARLHYAITNSGGISPNVVQAEAEVLYKLRVPRSEQLDDMYQRVCNVARGAALMTGTELEIQFDSGSSELIMNRTLEQLMYDQFVKLGVPVFDEMDNQFAAQIRNTLTDAELKNNLPAELANKNLSDQLEPYDPVGGIFMGSTDVGDVSWKAPTAQCTVASVALGTPFHTWQVVSQGATSIAHKGMLHAGKVVGATALEVLLQPELLKQAKAEHAKELDGRTYQCPIPVDVNPGPVKRQS